MICSGGLGRTSRIRAAWCTPPSRRKPGTDQHETNLGPWAGLLPPLVIWDGPPLGSLVRRPIDYTTVKSSVPVQDCPESGVSDKFRGLVQDGLVVKV